MNNLSSKNTNQQLLHSIEQLLDDASTVMVEKRCVHCGSVMQAVPTTFFVWGSNKTWEVPLLLCSVCNPKEKCERDHEANNIPLPM